MSNAAAASSSDLAGFDFTDPAPSSWFQHLFKRFKIYNNFVVPNTKEQDNEIITEVLEDLKKLDDHYHHHGSDDNRFPKTREPVCAVVQEVVHFFEKHRDEDHLDFCRRVHELFRELHAGTSGSFTVAVCAQTYGSLLVKLGRIEEAIPHYSEARDGFKAGAWGNGHWRVTNELATLFDRIGNLPKALELELEILEIEKQRVNAQSPQYQRWIWADEPSVVETLNRIGALLRELKRPAEALFFQQQSLAMSMRLDQRPSREHLYCADISVTLADLGRNEEALEMSTKALGIWEQSWKSLCFDNALIQHGSLLIKVRGEISGGVASMRQGVEAKKKSQWWLRKASRDEREEKKFVDQLERFAMVLKQHGNEKEKAEGDELMTEVLKMKQDLKVTEDENSINNSNLELQVADVPDVTNLINVTQVEMHRQIIAGNNAAADLDPSVVARREQWNQEQLQQKMKQEQHATASACEDNENQIVIAATSMSDPPPPSGTSQSDAASKAEWEDGSSQPTVSSGTDSSTQQTGSGALSSHRIASVGTYSTATVVESSKASTEDGESRIKMLEPAGAGQ